MDPVSKGSAARRSSAPTTLRMVEGLRRLRSATEPNAVGVRSVTVRTTPSSARQTVYTNPNP